MVASLCFAAKQPKSVTRRSAARPDPSWLRPSALRHPVAGLACGNEVGQPPKPSPNVVFLYESILQRHAALELFARGKSTDRE